MAQEFILIPQRLVVQQLFLLASLDNKEITHVYISDDIRSGSSHWCVKHGMMEKIEIKKPSVSSNG